MNAPLPLQPTPEAAARPATVVCLSVPFDLKKIFGGLDDARLVLRDPEEIERPEDVTAALCWNPADDAFDRFPNIRLAASIAAGVGGILACPSLPAGAVVTRVRDDAQADLMAGYAAFAVLWHHRRMDDYVANQAARKWVRSFRPAAPAAVPVGVLGYGLMGRAVARAVAALGFPVIAAARSGGEAMPGVEIVSGPGAIETVAARAKILVNVLPLTAETRDVLNADLFAKMPEGAALVQIGRGEHMVEDDFLAALDAGRIGSATLDVFRQEPLPEDHPFWTHPRIMMTPHKASDTSREETIRQLGLALDQLEAGLRPDAAVDREAGY